MKESSEKQVLLSAVAWSGVMLVIVLLLAVTYWPNQAPSIELALAEERAQKVQEVKATQMELTSQYVREADGRLRIPVEEAMDLVLIQLNDKSTQ